MKIWIDSLIFSDNCIKICLIPRPDTKWCVICKSTLADLRLPDLERDQNMMSIPCHTYPYALCQGRVRVLPNEHTGGDAWRAKSHHARPWDRSKDKLVYCCCESGPSAENASSQQRLRNSDLPREYSPHPTMWG